MKISIIVPCYDEGLNLDNLCQRLSSLSLGINKEIILVDDGSSDDTWQKILNQAKISRGEIMGAKLTSNQGNQIAMAAGLFLASGDFAVVIDADLQDPPEIIGRMLDLARKNNSAAVVALKKKRQDQSKIISFIKILSCLIFPFKTGEGDFCLINREILSKINEDANKSPFRVKRYFASRGAKINYLDYSRLSRAAGKSKFNLKKLAKLWFWIFCSLYFRNSQEKIKISLIIEKIVKK